MGFLNCFRSSKREPDRTPNSKPITAHQERSEDEVSKIDNVDSTPRSNPKRSPPKTYVPTTYQPTTGPASKPETWKTYIPTGHPVTKSDQPSTNGSIGRSKLIGLYRSKKTEEPKTEAQDDVKTGAQEAEPGKQWVKVKVLRQHGYAWDVPYEYRWTTMPVKGGGMAGKDKDRPSTSKESDVIYGRSSPPSEVDVTEKKDGEKVEGLTGEGASSSSPGGEGSSARDTASDIVDKEEVADKGIRVVQKEETPSPSSSSSARTLVKSTPPSPLDADEKEVENVVAIKAEVKLVGISGCSSSGKSTLAFLLSEIFNPTPQDSTGKRFLTQDDFFRPKKDIPHTTFTDADCKFACRSATQKSGDGFYSFTHYNSRGVVRWRIEGPNCDGAAAVDFHKLREAVASLKEFGEVSMSLELVRVKSKLGLVQDTGEVAGEATKAIPTLQSHRSQSEAPAMEGKAVKFAFVEGFRLFADPKVSPGPKALDWDRHIIHAKLDIPIFLPTSKEVAKTRRFSRQAYKDLPEGDRAPGHMWKSEGYFEQVLWPEYMTEFGWLLDQLGDEKVKNGGQVDGVWVRDGDDLGVEETVRWVVDLLLKEAHLAAAT
ncbi:P-loop containing nucleoside triphosphate hydrolase [Glarea lozoyensis ATCC 20868]|uniref:p-loop containing nucleoside triphosphate hydrolase n=1 Tax=Glarea lozoyensis (strain ATCC 20868 / MF5171) TaxID=1116229 RepID=S3CG61_GLAL2|nr:P-loop containing nucleoside triphosphate hydrolase [Glarea lozoyensis ATCC 20868]EPE24239.1 P-loop containing nucleoside triphosphate hydrolase [Glarea lozoyensis ATCC 20868]